MHAILLLFQALILLPNFLIIASGFEQLRNTCDGLQKDITELRHTGYHGNSNYQQPTGVSPEHHSYM